MTRKTVLMVLIVLGLVAGCTTHSTQNISNYEGQSTVVNRFDESRAAESRVQAAQRYLQQNSLQRAKYHLDKAAEHDDDLPSLHFTLGYYYQMARDYEQADDSFKRALRLDSKNPEFKNAYAQFLCQRGKYDDAMEYFKEAIDTPTYTNISQAYVNAGRCLRTQDKNKEAIDYFRRALNINSELPTALIEMAQYEYDQERFERAVRYIKRYRDVARHIPRTLWLALRAEHKLGNRDAVASYALQLENLYPDSRETLEYLDSREQWQ
ncbi:type IV pilus biogenesis/stability protein PilW [Pleionea sediminis]|uniref:type IV pilus biogenesis/stability protein PilW n=1 Tax=Pleionea sediminis TaxID=2569479 RepID=UPI001184891D|nr:type IV pilus biogenesis/stability protein PilW [Pleionea sediminis]